jgi:transcriptional regulator with XRE-family HTH domain
MAETRTIQMSQKSPSPIDKHIGQRVRMQRTLLGMSQERLGELLGITFQQVQKYEKGTNRISASRLHDLARVLGVDVPFFFQGSGERNPAESEPSLSPINKFLSDREGIELAKAFVAITDAGVRRAIVELARASATSSSASERTDGSGSAVSAHRKAPVRSS